MLKKINVIGGGLLLALTAPATAQEGSSAAAQANNPLANMTAFNIQDYYIGELTESDDSANQAWLRFAKPFSVGDSNWIMRASLPINTFPTPPRGEKETHWIENCMSWMKKRDRRDGSRYRRLRVPRSAAPSGGRRRPVSAI